MAAPSKSSMKLRGGKKTNKKSNTASRKSEDSSLSGSKIGEDTKAQHSKSASVKKTIEKARVNRIQGNNKVPKESGVSDVKISHEAAQAKGVKKRVRVKDLEVAPRVPFGGLCQQTVESAVAALLKRFQVEHDYEDDKKGAGAVRLLNDAEKVFLVFQLCAPPMKPSLKTKKALLKHSLFKDGDYELCLFVKDPAEEVERMLDEVGHGGVTRVMGLKELKTEYGTFERRRKLADMFDLFLCDSRVTPSMPKLLGNAFIKSKKLPMEVNMSRALPGAIESAVSSTALWLPKGDHVLVQVGRTKFTKEQIVENINSVVKRAVEVFNDEVIAIYIKTNRSVVVPIYAGITTPMDASKKPQKVDDIDEIMEMYIREEVVVGEAE